VFQGWHKTRNKKDYVIPATVELVFLGKKPTYKQAKKKNCFLHHYFVTILEKLVSAMKKVK
jgi:hypothetical protein